MNKPIPTVIIQVMGGVAHVAYKSKGLCVIIEDFDCPDSGPGHKTGKHVHSVTYKGSRHIV